jgi:hypothetical protein
LVLGEDVKMHQVFELANQALTGRLFEHKTSKAFVKGWMEMEWEPIIGYVVLFHVLVWGWLVFIFKKERDAHKILSTRGRWGNVELLLKMWSHFFDPRLENH